MTYGRSRSPNATSMAKLQCKLERIVSRKDQLKVSFNHLKSHIKTGLLETEDVFSSLAVPLMKLVGLKSAEMAGEGRSNTFFMKTPSNDQYEFEDMLRENPHKPMSTGQRGCDLQKLEEDYTNNAIMAGNELIHKQKQLLIQLLKLLKQVENCVNSSQKNMFQTIEDHKDRIHVVLRKAVTYISVNQQSTHNDQASEITLKLLKALYDLVTQVLSSVEGGVDDLINKLTDEMCKPMIEYAKSCKAEITAGTCPRLLVALEDMKEVAGDGRVELEQARKMMRVAEERRVELEHARVELEHARVELEHTRIMMRAAEERKIEALSMLRESEEKIKKMKQSLDLSINDKKEPTGRYAKNKLLAPASPPPAPQKDQTEDDKLLWEVLKKKQTGKQPQSPFGPTELFHARTRTSTKIPNPTTGKPSTTHSHRPTTRAYSKLKTRSSGSLLALGLSPALPRISGYRVFS